jgi:pectinesterase
MRHLKSAWAAWAAGACAVAALLAACAAPSAPSAPSAPARQPAPLAPASYTAETTYAKLARTYPFIRIASRELPPSVRALRNLTYVWRGDHALQLDLYLPAQPSGASLPGIVFVHGGGWRAGVRDNFAPMAIRMAERGFASVTISYRLSPEAPYPAAIHDVKAAVRWVRAHAGEYGIDPARIAIAGGSAGGQIAALVGVTNGVDKFDPDRVAGAVSSAVSSAVQAIVNIDGLSDFTSEAARSYEDDPAKQPSSAGAWFGGRYAEKEALWREASPLFHVNRATPPVLFIVSGQPRFSLGREEMAAKLAALGVPTRTLVLPGTPHSFWLFDPWLGPTVEATAAFLADNLSAKALAP